MSKKQNIEIYNEEVREIMKEIPGNLIRWGLTIIFLVFISIVAGSYFFTFKEIVSAPLSLTTTSPPAPLISRASGRIARWFVSDGEKVDKGNNVALVENPADMDDLFRLEKIISYLDTSDIENLQKEILLPENIVLGDLQSQYNQFYSNWANYRDYTEYNFLPKKIELLRQQIEKQEQYYQLSLEQKKMMEAEMEMEKRGLERHRVMLEKGGVSEAQFEEAQTGISQSQRNYTGFVASLKSTEINMIGQKSSLLELQEQHHKTVQKYQLDIADNIRSLKNLINNWKENYLLVSPVAGTVTFTKFWSENHVVSVGERLASIVPADRSVIICRAVVPSSGIGKVELGQQVNVKLSGFPYLQHGILKGKISSVSLVPESEGYIVEIKLEEGMISSYSVQLKLIQEMDGTAEIVTKEMRMIYRFINPLKILFKNE